jgi:hypothetical protein
VDAEKIKTTGNKQQNGDKEPSEMLRSMDKSTFMTPEMNIPGIESRWGIYMSGQERKLTRPYGQVKKKHEEIVDSRRGQKRNPRTYYAEQIELMVIL